MIIEGYCNWHHPNKANHVGILLFKGKKDFKALTVFICVENRESLGSCDATIFCLHITFQ